MPQPSPSEVLLTSLHVPSSPSPPERTNRVHVSNYLTYSISTLTQGPIFAHFIGIVVNIAGYKIENTDESDSPKAKGCWKLLLKDNTGRSVILVKFWYADNSFKFILGDVVEVWATHVSGFIETKRGGDSIQKESGRSSLLSVSIFPERDAGCNIKIMPGRSGLEDVEVLRLNEQGYLLDLAYLEGFTAETSVEASDIRLLVCVVAIGESKTTTAKSGRSFTNLDVGVVDSSSPWTSCSHATLAATILSFSSPLHPSATKFRPNHTVLLLINPKLISRRKLILTPQSQTIVDPRIHETFALRRYVYRLKPPCNALVPPIIISNTNWTKRQYTFSLFLSQIQQQPTKRFVAYISAILARLDLVDLWRRRRLFCMPCPVCKKSVFDNLIQASCLGCYVQSSSIQLIPGHRADGNNDRESPIVQLRLNPQIVASVSDETGGFSLSADRSFATSPASQPPSRPRVLNHGIIISDTAWKSLLGRSPHQMALLLQGDSDEVCSKLRDIERRLSWLRLTFVLAWTGEAEDVEISTTSSPRYGKCVILNIIS